MLDDNESSDGGDSDEKIDPEEVPRCRPTCEGLSEDSDAEVSVNECNPNA